MVFGSQDGVFLKSEVLKSVEFPISPGKPPRSLMQHHLLSDLALPELIIRPLAITVPVHCFCVAVSLCKKYWKQ